MSSSGRLRATDLHRRMEGEGGGVLDHLDARYNVGATTDAARECQIGRTDRDDGAEINREAGRHEKRAADLQTGWRGGKSSKTDNSANHTYRNCLGSRVQARAVPPR